MPFAPKPGQIWRDNDTRGNRRRFVRVEPYSLVGDTIRVKIRSWDPERDDYADSSPVTMVLKKSFHGHLRTRSTGFTLSRCEHVKEMFGVCDDCNTRHEGA